MTRNILRTTTALALSLALTAPNAVIGADAKRSFAAGAFQVAQADNASTNGKSKDRKDKKADAEPCADGSEPPCAATEAAEEASKGEANAAEAPGQVKKEEAPAESAEEKPAEEPKAEEAAATEAPTEAPAEESPASVTEAPEPKQEAPAAATEKPEKKKKKEERKADSGSEAPPAPVAEEPAPEKAAETTPAPADDAKPVETQDAAKSEAPKSEETATEAAPEKETTKAPAVVEKVEEQPKAAATEANAAPVDVTSETVTEETTRTSDEEVAVAKSGDGKKKEKDDSDDLYKILGAAAGGVVVGVLLNEAFGGGKVVESTGDRVIIERDGEYIVRKDENEILRRPGSTVRNETFRDGSSRTVVDRANGVQVVTIRDAEGYVVRRSRIMPDGQEILLFDDTNDTRQNRWVRIEENEYPRYDNAAPHRRYIDYGGADRRALNDVLRTRPIAEFNRSYSLRQVREDERVRDAMPRLDLDVLTFETGSAAISPRQARNLDPLGWAMQDILIENPDEVFLIEGHTDAVGSRFSNLVLSDRRAEAVALALTEYYDIPPENLITQGYGEEFLKIETDQAERANRRAAVRRITPLLEQTAQKR